MAEASILHADLDAFYASVEQRDHPRLRGRPVIVGGGVVLAASYEARITGVRSAMRAADARERCPHAVWMPARMDAYAEASRRVFACFDDVTPLVEPISVDEAFLDVSGAGRLLGAPADIAATLRRTVAREVGLPLSVGVARTKFLAKVASQQAKPDGMVVVAPAGEIEFLHPLPVEVLWGVGKVTAAKLHGRGIDTVGDLAASRTDGLIGLLGPASGRHLRALAHNRDPRSVEPHRRDRTMGSQRALGQRRREVAELREMLMGLVDKIARRLRRAEKVTRTITVRYRTFDFRQRSRARTFAEATDDTATLVRTAHGLLDGLVDGPHGRGSALAREGCSLIGITVSGLEPNDAVQLALPFPECGRSRHGLDRALDDIKERWGNDMLARAALLGQEGGIEMLARPSAVDAPERVDR